MDEQTKKCYLPEGIVLRVLFCPRGEGYGFHYLADSRPVCADDPHSETSHRIEGYCDDGQRMATKKDIFASSIIRSIKSKDYRFLDTEEQNHFSQLIEKCHSQKDLPKKFIFNPKGIPELEELAEQKSTLN